MECIFGQAVLSVSSDHGVPDEGGFWGGPVEDEASVVWVAGDGVHGGELGGEAGLGGGEGEAGGDHVGMELLALCEGSGFGVGVQNKSAIRAVDERSGPHLWGRDDGWAGGAHFGFRSSGVCLCQCHVIVSFFPSTSTVF